MTQPRERHEGQNVPDRLDHFISSLALWAPGESFSSPAMIHALDSELWFPDPDEPSDDDYEGLLAVGGDLSIERMLLAYQSGIFPWSVNPITWWSPNPRGIIEFDHFHISRSLKRVLKQAEFTVTANQSFRAVISACAAAKRDGSWIGREFIDAYTALHHAGHAHSVECWQGKQLVGGIYGVAVGGLFAGESMFHHVSNASKVALVRLVQRLADQGFQLFDVQMVTPTTEQFGAIEIPRTEYLERLRSAVANKCTF